MGAKPAPPSLAPYWANPEPRIGRSYPALSDSVRGEWYFQVFGKSEMGILKYGAEAQGMKMQRSQTEYDKILEHPPLPYTPLSLPSLVRLAFPFPREECLSLFNVMKPSSSAGGSLAKNGAAETRIPQFKPGSLWDPWRIPHGSQLLLRQTAALIGDELLRSSEKCAT